jgi:hypothetical protein
VWRAGGAGADSFSRRSAPNTEPRSPPNPRPLATLGGGADAGREGLGAGVYWAGADAWADRRANSVRSTERAISRYTSRSAGVRRLSRAAKRCFVVASSGRSSSCGKRSGSPNNAAAHDGGSECAEGARRTNSSKSSRYATLNSSASGGSWLTARTSRGPAMVIAPASARTKLSRSRRSARARASQAGHRYHTVTSEWPNPSSMARSATSCSPLPLPPGSSARRGGSAPGAPSRRRPPDPASRARPSPRAPSRRG